MTTEELQEKLQAVADDILAEHGKTDKSSKQFARYFAQDRARAGIMQDCWKSELERCLRDAEVI